jgi:hypothetical protein
VKKLKVGQRVTVVGKATREIVRATVYAVQPLPGGREHVAVQVLGRVEIRHEFEHEEGITWARGWRGKAIDALRAYVALTDTGMQFSPIDMGSVLHEFMHKTYKRFAALPPGQKLLAVGAAAVTAEVVISALAVPLARKT